MNTQFSSRAKNAFLAGAAVNVLAILVGLYLLPARTALHFNAQGYVDRWGSRPAFIAINLIMVIITYYTIEYGAKLVLKFPKKLISLPAKDYWLSPEQRPLTERKLTDYLRAFGALNFIFQTILFGLIIAAHHVKPVRLNTTCMIACTLGFLLVTGVWCVWLYRAFKRKQP